MSNLLVGMTGSMEILSMPSYLAAFRQVFQNLKIIMSHSAQQFIPKESFEVFSDGIYANEFPLSIDNMSHVELARWADLFIIIPASAHVIAQAAHGICDTLLSTTILAFESKIHFFPNMNTAMWENPALQRNVDLLKCDGHHMHTPIQKPAFEYASRQVEVNHVLPSIESVLSILQIEATI